MLRSRSRSVQVGLVVLIVVGGVVPGDFSPSPAAGADQVLQPVGESLDGESVGDFTGSAVVMSADGTRIAFGSPGSDADGVGDWAGRVRVFDWNGAGWVQVGDSIDGNGAHDFAGSALAMSANGARIAVGYVPDRWFYDVASGDEVGRVRVFDWDGSTWVQVGDAIEGEAPGDRTGSAVAMSADGGRIAVGAPQSDADGVGQSAGRVRVFEWESAAWAQVGANLDGERMHDWQGTAVAFSADGDRLAVGADQANDTAGRVRIYDWNDGWTQVGSDIGCEESDPCWSLDVALGTSLAFSSDGLTLAVGGQETVPAELGDDVIWVFRWDGSDWVQIGSESDPLDNGYVEVAISADGSRVAIGVARASGTANTYGPGQARVYDWDGAAWQAVVQIIGGDGDRTGQAMAMSADGSLVAVGSPGEADQTGTVRVYALVDSPPTSSTVAATSTTMGPQTPPGGTLPGTGSNGGMAAVAALLVLAGAVMVAGARRRLTCRRRAG